LVFHRCWLFLNTSGKKAVEVFHCYHVAPTTGSPRNELTVLNPCPDRFGRDVTLRRDLVNREQCLAGASNGLPCRLAECLDLIRET